MASCLSICHSGIPSAETTIENFFCEAPIVIALSCGDPQFSLRVIFADTIVVLLSPMVLIVISYARILASILGRNSSSGRGKTFSTCASHLTVVIFFYTSAMFSYMNPRSTHGPDKDKPFSLLYTIITPMCNPVIYSFRNCRGPAPADPGYSKERRLGDLFKC